MNTTIQKKPYRPIRVRLLDNIVFIWFTCILFSLVVRLFFLLSRVERRYHPDALPYLNGSKPLILCFWHGRLVYMPFINPPGRKMNALISRSRDGIMVATAMKCFGISTVHGSKSKGATEAMLGLLEVTAQGQNVAITPDGPRGPGQVSAPGAAFLASKSGYPLVPVSFSCSRHKRFNRSWDRFMAPWPFSKIVFTSGAPIFVPADAETGAIKNATKQLTAALNAATAEADAACGVE